MNEAAACFREAIRLEPGDAEAHSMLGTALSWQGKTDEAVAAFRESVRLVPNNTYAQLGLGYALEQIAKPEEAIGRYRIAIRLHRTTRRLIPIWVVHYRVRAGTKRASPSAARRSGWRPTMPTRTSASDMPFS